MSYKPSMYMNTANVRAFIQLFGYEEYDRLLSLDKEDDE